MKEIAKSLPNDVIFYNILPRLLVKSLLRFKSVCRRWCSTISSPEFAKSHLAFSRSRHKFLLLQDYAMVKNPDYRLLRRRFEYGGEYRSQNVVDSCNGIVCFYFKILDTVKFFLVNPATCQRVEILAPNDKYFTRYSYWFGYVSSLDDYKIVAFSLMEGGFWMFSLKAGIWKRISYTNVTNTSRVASRLGRHPALINDSLYWPIDLYYIDYSSNVGTEIVELNLVSEEYELKPPMRFAYFGSRVHLLNLNGVLALHTTSYSLDVWVLRKMDDWNSWEKVYSKDSRHFQLIYFATTGKLLVSHLKQLKIVDDLSQLPPEGQGRRRQQQQYEGEQEIYHHLDGMCVNYLTRSDVGDYVESLIWPFL